MELLHSSNHIVLMHAYMDIFVLYCIMYVIRTSVSCVYMSSTSCYMMYMLSTAMWLCHPYVIDFLSDNVLS